jgi:RNase P/RNase MRP subunit p29
MTHLIPGTRVRVADSDSNGYAGLVGTVTDDSLTPGLVMVAVITGEDTSHVRYQLLHLTADGLEVLP